MEAVIRKYPVMVYSQSTFCPNRVQWVKLAVGMVAASAVGIALYHIDPAKSSFYPPCLFHALTGLHCPGCGTLRALHQLFNGNLAAAFSLNPLTIVLLPFIGWDLISYLMRMVTNKELPEIFIPAKWIRIFLALVILFAVLRNIPAFPFTWLAP